MICRDEILERREEIFREEILERRDERLAFLNAESNIGDQMLLKRSLYGVALITTWESCEKYDF
jgi:hypothetical protein